MAQFDDGSVIEGLLCPICLQDQQTIQQLQEHFDNAHSNEKDLSLSLKGFFAKAKRKILKQDNLFDPEDEANNTPEKKSPKNAFINWGSQDIGFKTLHTDTFLRIRNSRVENYVIETNKLIIRLEKLLIDPNIEPEKRKAYEKNVVSWIEDNDVKLCPGCAKSFGISRRRHHCRLCGAIMCNACSNFIDHNFAKNLIQPALSQEYPQSTPKKKMSISSVKTMTMFSSPSSSNVNEYSIRICIDCFRLLERRSLVMEQRNTEPVIMDFYEKMRSKMIEVDHLMITYERMQESLSVGETTYNMKDALDIKKKITKGAETIEILSKKILSLGEHSAHQKALQLHSSIRLAASQFLRDRVLGMPPLPTEEEYAYQIDVRRQRQNQVSKPSTFQHESSPTSSFEMVSPTTGWTPDQKNNAPLARIEDPMLQQINIIRNYIKQARLDNKLDEVDILEENLRELQKVYRQQQEQFGNNRNS